MNADVIAWEDEADHPHVTGTHDVDSARLVLLDYVIRAGAVVSAADLLEIATTSPCCWWAFPQELPGSDVEYPAVPAGTAGAVPMLTWPGDFPVVSP